ncbi:tyrosinase family protein [Mycolicibacterium stellerae]|uniref:tyrosinase family protein n=1 Tax=Mycolicibacterium stellerae TaxID=2358193 RepID=UPI000F0BABBA|nr:tyrosinase family protein [Mycolicibacterium stellerae]
MPKLFDLQARSRAIFESLLAEEYPTRRPTLIARTSSRTGTTGTFSWFNPEDARKATILAGELAAVAAMPDEVLDGLETALDRVESARAEEPTALVRTALSLFTTHYRPARRLAVPRPVASRPAAFGRSRAGTVTRRARTRRRTPHTVTVGSPTEAQLDYWREDALANEHHRHWHEVYPYAGIPPQDWDVWARDTDRAGLAQLFQELDPQPQNHWAEFIALRPAEIRQAFLSRLQQLPDIGVFLNQLSAVAYRALFRLNDRQGEIFLYMHAQMLARYDAERLSVGLTPVAAFNPPYTARSGDGYDPAPLPGYLPRPFGVPLSDNAAQDLTTMHAEVVDAIDNGALLGATAADVAIDRTTLGEAIEATEARLRVPLRTGRYPGLHNIGHGRIAGISVPPPGSSDAAVMNDPTAAIRDPIFWRWHKGIDDLSAQWQDGQPPYTYDDAPSVAVRDGLAGVADAWQSPDIYLIQRPRFTESATAAQKIEAALGGANADVEVTDGPVTGLRGYRLTGTLTTRFRQGQLGRQTVDYLTHDPFGYAVRIRNQSGRDTSVTVRVFLVPLAFAEQRRKWIEFDKTVQRIPKRSTTVLYRPDIDFSVIKTPAEQTPAEAIEADPNPDDDGYCICGWPWTLVLPRGTREGLPCAIAVACTDAGIDTVPATQPCGSMSYCGAVDRYPDIRDMGHPFSRPMPDGVAKTVLAQPTMAGRSLTIRHVA